MIIEATWDEKFGKREPGGDEIFLMAGEACLGYVSRSRGKFMGCVGSGIGAPIVYYGRELEKAKQSVEDGYRTVR